MSEIEGEVVEGKFVASSWPKPRFSNPNFLTGLLGSTPEDPKREVVRMEKEIEEKARELYEESRKHVSGRRSWEALDPNDPYDMGMRSTAIAKASEWHRKQCVASTAKAIASLD